VPGSIPNIITGFCKEGVIFTAGADEQKYQNLFQLFFRAFIVCMAKLFYLQANHKTTPVGGILVPHPAIFSVLQNNLPD
jgi:hypothetical protein